MSTAHPATSPSDSLNAHYLLRKFHSLTGLIPVGAFLAFHLWENALSYRGSAFYNEHVVRFINDINYIRFIEIFVLLLPIAFHAVYGVVVWWQGKSNVARFGHGRNIMYLLQRLTSWFVLGFILYHIYTTRWAAFVDERVFADLHGHMARLLADPLHLTLHIIGVVTATFHLCNGLWLLGLNWGFTTHPRAQTISTVVCFSLFAIVTFFGIHGLIGFNDPISIGSSWSAH